MEHAAAAVTTDYLLTETGGMPMPTPGGKLLPVPVAEKGSCWCRLRVRGEAGHASMPFHADNALSTAAEVVRRLVGHRPVPEIHDTWKAMVDAMAWSPEMTEALLDPARLDVALEELAASDLGLAREAHACTHTTIAPTIVHGGSKINTIPDRVELDLDIRTLPGWGPQDVREMIGDALGDLAARVDIVEALDDPATASRSGTPLWDRLATLAAAFHPDGRLVPTLQVGATDARFFRRKGTVCYGFGMFSERIGYDRFGAMFHGDDERIDVGSLAWSAAAFEQLARDFLGR